MEAIALSNQAIAMTGQPLLHNPEYAAIEKIEPYLSLHWQQQNKRGFFFEPMTLFLLSERRSKENMMHSRN